MQLFMPFCAICVLFFSHFSYAKPQLAVVIDDLGYGKMPKEIAAFPPEISIAIIPFSPDDQDVATSAKEQSREVLLHLPMQSIKGHGHEKNTLSINMSKEQIQTHIANALLRIPSAVAVNNHMGSLFTQHSEKMGWVMETLQDRGIGFLDSRTTAKTVAHSTAKRYRLSTNRRHVFLDHHPNPRFIKRQLAKAIHHAKKQGIAIVVAHPLPITLKMLKHALPDIQKEVELVPISHALINAATQFAAQ